MKTRRWFSIGLVVVLVACGRTNDPAPPKPDPGGPPVASAALSTFDVRVASGDDDAEERASGHVNLTSSDLELVFDRENQVVGIRFVGVDVPAGALVSSAFVQFQADETNDEPTDLVIFGEASADASVFERTSANVSSRARTEASVAWSPEPWLAKGEAGEAQRTPDLSTIVQEVVGSASWTAGNAMVLMISGSGVRVAESFNGTASAAPLLHVEYALCADASCNFPPQADAGEDVTVSVDTVVSLDGSGSSDPEGAPLSFAWSFVSRPAGSGATLAGASSSLASFTPDVAGSYLLELTVSDGQDSATDQVTVSAYGGELVPVAGIVQANHFYTGAGYGADRTSSTWLPVPAIDPSGVDYHPPTQRLLIVDSEIEEEIEPWAYAGGNAFATTLTGDTLLDTWDLYRSTNGEKRNHEPTGVAYCAFDGRVYVTNDSRETVYRYVLDENGFFATDWVVYDDPTYDAEDLTCDPTTGRIYVISGLGQGILAYDFDGTFRVADYLDLVVTAGDPAGVPSDPEGIVFDPISRHLFVASAPDRRIFEYDLNGRFVAGYDFSGFSPVPRNSSGLGIGPSSDGSASLSFYFVDRMTDNNKDANERDGGVYEAVILRAW